MREQNDQASTERDLIAVSALQHYLYCPRQCALIHVEQLWAENLFTAEGQVLHQRNTEPGHEIRRGVKTIMAMPLVSHSLGVCGVADVVELHEQEQGMSTPYPVEYKRGKPKGHRADEVQLCAQAICLEEMFVCQIDEAALFYGKNRRRKVIELDHALRELTKQIAKETRYLILSQVTPAPDYDKKRCENCSLKQLCRPKQLQKRSSVKAWLSRLIGED